MFANVRQRLLRNPVQSDLEVRREGGHVVDLQVEVHLSLELTECESTQARRKSEVVEKRGTQVVDGGSRLLERTIHQVPRRRQLVLGAVRIHAESSPARLEPVPDRNELLRYPVVYLRSHAATLLLLGLDRGSDERLQRRLFVGQRAEQVGVFDGLGHKGGGQSKESDVPLAEVPAPKRVDVEDA